MEKLGILHRIIVAKFLDPGIIESLLGRVPDLVILFEQKGDEIDQLPGGLLPDFLLKFELTSQQLLLVLERRLPANRDVEDHAEVVEVRLGGGLHQNLREELGSLVDIKLVFVLQALEKDLIENLGNTPLDETLVLDVSRLQLRVVDVEVVRFLERNKDPQSLVGEPALIKVQGGDHVFKEVASHAASQDNVVVARV